MRQRPSKNLAARLTALLQATRVIASSLDLEQSLHAIIQQATIISETNAVRLLLLDEETQALHYRAGSGLPPEEERNLVMPVDESFSGQVVATGKPLAIPDMRGDPRLHNPQHAGKYGLLSYLGLPVKVGDRVIGVLVFNTDAPHVYGADEIAFLSAFAAQAAIVIQNARLYDAAQRELTERARTEAVLRTRTQQLETVRAIGEEITRELDLRAVLDLIMRRAVELVGTSSGMLRLWDEEAGLLVPQSWVGLDMQRAAVSLRLGEGVAGTAAEQRQGLLVNDFRHSPYATPLLLERTTHVAILAEPLLYRDRLVGVINLNREEPGQPFEDEDRQLLALFAAQAVIAIENARLFEATERAAREARSFYEVAHTLTTSLDPAEVLNLISMKTTELLGTPHAQVVLWDEDTRILHLGAAHGTEAEKVKSQEFRLGEGVNGTVAETRAPLIVNDYQAFPKRVPGMTELVAVIGVPLLYRGRLLGVLSSHATKPGSAFTESHLALLASFAAQAAIAIEKARLYEAAQRRSAELEALLRASRSLMSGLDLQGILDRILAEAAEMAGRPHVRVALVDREARVLRVARIKGELVSAGFEYPLEGSLSGLVVTSGEPVFSPDVQTDPRSHFGPRYRDLGIVTYLGLPIKSRGEVVGVLIFNTTEPREYTRETLAYLTSFADQAAIAIENARLYEEIRRHAEELETRVRQRTAELEEALRVKVEFLGKMSHELRTPLNFILGFSDLLQQGTGGPLTPKQATYLDRIQGGGRRLLSLVSDVLDIAQLDAGKSRLRLEPVILAPLVQEVLGLVQIQVSQKRLKVTTALDPWMPFIVADRFKLAQILHNLVGNAVKFTPEGGSIRIITRQVPAAGNGTPDGGVQPSASPDSVELIVEDTGIGIRPENLETAFEAFYQVDGSETRAQGGVGLGLPLVRRLVELHGGRVWAESAGPGQGSRFVVRLPRLEVSKAKRILLVEDEALIRIPMAAALESAGFDVSQAAMGADALAVMEAEAFDLLILDVVLPDMEGWEILRRVREVEEVRTLPVLVVTGLESLNAEQALALGADEFLTKPVSPRVLVDTVVRLLASSAASSAGVGPRSLRTGERPGE